MIIIKKTCDICKKESGTGISASPWMTIDYVGGISMFGEKTHWDICPDCSTKVLKKIVEIKKERTNGCESKTSAL